MTDWARPAACSCRQARERCRPSCCQADCNACRAAGARSEEARVVVSKINSRPEELALCPDTEAACQRRASPLH